MFRLLNKSAISHLCQCVNNWLWNSWNGPSPALYFSPLLDPTPAYPGPTIAGGCEMPPPDSRPGVHGRLVGRSVGGIKFLTLFRCAGSVGRRAFQVVGSAKRVISVNIPC